MNCVTLTGTISRPPKTGVSANNKHWCFFSIACQGFRESVDYFSIKAFGETAQIVGAMSEGMAVEIVGKLGSEKPQEDGSKQWTMIVVADRVTTPMGTSKGAAERKPASERTRPSVPEDDPRAGKPYVAPEPDQTQDDLPF